MSIGSGPGSGHGQAHAMAASPAPLSLTPASGGQAAPAPGAQISHHRLDNGMEVVVIPDHRAPVVTHMVWYRNGSADDPLGKSGIAHFLEHLMFKGTRNHPQGAFSEIVAELGGQENAFTSNDYTAYFQRVPKDCLRVMMEFEADRMTNLVLTDEIVAPERDVVLEERRMRTDGDPGAQLNEAVQAALYTHHPYGKPIIGWQHEIESLSREDALAYYQRFYTPENAILIVAGDIEAEEALALARDTYGAIPARGEAPRRERPREPGPRAHRTVTLADSKVEQPTHQRVYLVPSYRTAEAGEAEALEIAAHLIGGGPTSLLYRKLVMEERVAVSAGAYYYGTALDDSGFYLWTVPAPGVSLETLDAKVESILADMARAPLDEADLARAKTRLIADAVYAQDNQSMLARWYGAALTTGESVEAVRTWPDRIDAVSAQDVRAAVAKWLTRKRCVTGFLMPEDAPETDQAA